MIAQEIILLDFALLFTYSISAFLVSWRIAKDYQDRVYIRSKLKEERQEFGIIEKEIKKKYKTAANLMDMRNNWTAYN